MNADPPDAARPPAALMQHTKHLHAFVAVCRAGSVTQAGERLRRAQSAVSRSVHELEAALGVDLFERNARGMLPTDFGKALLRRAELAFEDMEAARAALGEMARARGSRLRNAPVFSLAVTPRRLDVLIAFAERRHVGAVAQRLGVSQPAVSMALRELEGGLGLPLFDRAASGVGLTPAGEALLFRIRRALSQLRIAGAELSAMKGVVEGQVVVGALPFGRPYMLPVAIARLLREHPRLQVSTVEGPLDTLTAGVRSGDVDFVLGALPQDGQPSALVREELFSETMAVFVRAGHPLARRPDVGLRDALRSDWVLPRRGSPTREALAAVLSALALPPPRVAVESSDLSVIRGLLLETDMVSAASRQLFHHELQGGTLATLPIRLPGTARPIGILRRTQDHSSPGAQLLIEALRRVPARPAEAS